MPSSSIRLACSIESMPARIAFLMPCVPCACAAILRPAMCASSAAAFSSSGVNCGAPGLSPLEHAAGGKYLDYVHAVFHLGAHHVANLVNAIGDLEVALFRKHGDARLRR